MSGSLTEEDGQRLKSMIARYQSVGEKMDSLATRADKLLTRIDAGEGNLGAAIKDKQAFEDLRSLLADLRKNPWKLFWKD
jgi:phospholipid/cholesterol/gamma-HCH transport system substrate-binding protein